MGWNDRLDEDDGKSAFREELVEYGMLDGTANGITKKVIREGVDNDDLRGHALD